MADIAELSEKVETLRAKVHKARRAKGGISDALDKQWREAQEELAAARQAERSDR